MYEYKAVVSTQNQIMQVDANTGFSLVRQNTGFSLVRPNATFLQHLQLDIHCETAGQWSFDFFI